jgi:hypothetical protein
MALGDFIGSLQFYPWRERMLMPEEESIERVRADSVRPELFFAGADVPESPSQSGFRVRRPVHKSGRRRKPRPGGSEG